MVPFAELMARFAKRIIRDEPELDTHLKPKHLMSCVGYANAGALPRAAREVLRIGDAMEQMMEGLKSCTANRVKSGAQAGDDVNVLYTAIKLYLRECRKTRAGGGGVPSVWAGDY